MIPCSAITTAVLFNFLVMIPAVDGHMIQDFLRLLVFLYRFSLSS